MAPEVYSKDAGFTLIETLVAFVILSISLAIFTQSINQATTQIRTSEITAEVIQLSKRIMAAASVGGHRGGTGSDNAYLWNWTTRTFERSDETGTLVPLVLITVEIGRSPDAAPIFVLRRVMHHWSPR